jgi:hypothetical protein
MIRFVAFFLLVVGQVYGQTAKPIQFREETFDFGVVREDGGPVTHEFVFTNHGDQPVIITDARASCGCTTPSWSKDPVLPGETGHVQARYSPKGRPGHFSKSINITTNVAGTITLQIRGQVVSGMTGSEVDFKVVRGSWKLKNQVFNLGKVLHVDEPTVRDFPFINAGTKAVTFTEKVVGPSYIKVDVVPKTVAPGEMGHIKITYYGKQNAIYGFHSDNVELYTDDEKQNVKSFSVNATLEDYFPELSKEELAKAPQLRMSVNKVDFGKFLQSAPISSDLVITNTGKSELSLKSLQPNCTCVSAQASKNKIKPGESATVKLVFDPTGRKGTQQKALAIYSNDPVNPVQRITLAAYIE